MKRGVVLVSTAKPPRIALAILLIVQILFFDVSATLPIFIFRLALIIFIFCALFVRYQFSIEKKKLVYQILLFSKPMYKRILEPNEISEIRFKRVGWGAKAAIVKAKQGVNWRIINFEPVQVYMELANFAKENRVKVNDYEVQPKA